MLVLWSFGCDHRACSHCQGAETHRPRPRILNQASCVTQHPESGDATAQNRKRNQRHLQPDTIVEVNHW